MVGDRYSYGTDGTPGHNGDKCWSVMDERCVTDGNIGDKQCCDLGRWRPRDHPHCGHNKPANPVGWCRLTVSKPELKARLVSALETKM